ncbi:MarR family winged helix-turn-helix transcriptional regulator [Novosphingobium huizhouense]|uniref:MarR family winged helix-turn-helix transcriptional regulator n=1 Tax=Novosphingobium huizhouense TaxID=2866625 RepID=UPI001CD8A4A0|nr:MarR family transcriptional regulator [Novosphingobium huizhouense]
MQQKKTDKQPCVATTVRKANRALTRLYESALAEHGLSLAQYSLLDTLARAKALPLARLAERELLDRSSLTRALVPLERDGLVTVVDGPARSRVASLTDAGATRIKAARKSWTVTQATIIARIGPQNWAALAPWLGQIAEQASVLAEVPVALR